MLNKIEKSIFFPVVRIAGFISAVILLLIIAGGVVIFINYDTNQQKKTYVSFESITHSLNPKKASQSTVQEGTIQLQYSESINKYLSGENRQILDNWLDEYSTVKEKQNFLDNLSEVIIKAEKNKAEVVAYINEYKNLKQKNIKEDTLGINKYADPAIKGLIVFSLAIVFLLFTVVVMLLLLLSIERNTRKIN